MAKSKKVNSSKLSRHNVKSLFDPYEIRYERKNKINQEVYPNLRRYFEKGNDLMEDIDEELNQLILYREDNEESKILVNNLISKLKKLLENAGNNIYTLEFTANGLKTGIPINENTIKDIIQKLLYGINNEFDDYSGGSDNIKSFDISDIYNPSIVETKTIRNKSGGFFPYNNITEIDLSKYQIYKKSNSKSNLMSQDHCLIYAFKQSNLLTDKELESIKNFLTGANFPHDKLQLIAEKLSCTILLKKFMDPKYKTYTYKCKSSESRFEIKLGIYLDHYFINDIIPVHKFYIKNRELLKDNPKRFQAYKKSGTKYSYNNNYLNDAITIIRLIHETNGFEKLIFEDNLLKIDYNKLNKKYQSFELLESDCVLIDQMSEKGSRVFGEIIHADFETTTDKEGHKAFCVCFRMESKPNISHKLFNTDEESLAKEFLNKISQQQIKREIIVNGITKTELVAPIIYFHNMKYDYQFIYKYLYIVSTVERNNQLYEINAYYYGKEIIIRDSYKMISLPLSKFTKTFNLSSKKEAMPYDLYNYENIRKEYLTLEDINRHYILKKKNVSIKSRLELDIEKKQLLNNLKELNLIDGEKWNHKEYALFYCDQDVKTQMLGMMTQRKWVKESLKLDIYNYLTSASLADDYFIGEGCYEGVIPLTGSIRSFVQNFTVGGRVMCKDNKKIHVQEPVEDFDGVSLYPSAMARIPGFAKGVCKILKENELNLDWLNNNSDYYMVEIKIKSLKYELDTPTFSYKNKNGIRIWENKVPEESVYLDKIGLEDAINFHGIDFDIIKGIYWNEGFNDEIVKVIKKVFNIRNKLKKEGNPLESVYKLIMNSAYGKTIMKESPTTIEYIKVKDFDKYLSKNYNLIQSYSKINDLNYKIVRYQSIYKHINRAHCGVIILSMSKRIMNEVAYCAKLINCPIYYCDTDSIHIPRNKVKELEEKFKEIYGRNLIGKGLGQFHGDFQFDGMKDIYAVESVFIDKKVYCDKIRGIDNEGNEQFSYHFRLKGVSAKSIQYVCDKEFNGNMIDLYNSGKEIKFNLLADNQIKFEYKKYGGVLSRKEFIRKVKF